MSTDSSSPIGIFDSGVGGLTIAKSIVEALPNENIVYFGDTAHLPYGDKSKHAIEGFAARICDFLVEQQCKLIVVACNSASAAALEVIEKSANGVPVINVIDPVVQFFKAKNSYQKIGLIATRQTVTSKVYETKLSDANIQATVHALATPLLVPMIEFGYSQHAIMDVVVQDYLNQKNMMDVDALILGCTHYPIIKNKIKNHFSKDIVDATGLVAQAVKDLLEAKQLLSVGNTANWQFFVSDYTEFFENTAKLFFGHSVGLEHCPMWE